MAKDTATNDATPTATNAATASNTAGTTTTSAAGTGSEPVANVEGGGTAGVGETAKELSYGEVYAEEVTTARSRGGSAEPTEAEKRASEEAQLRAENPNKVVYRRRGEG